MNLKNLQWTIIVVIGALINVGVNYGYKVATGDLGISWLAASVMLVASLTLFGYAAITKRTGWMALGQGIMPFVVVGMGAMATGIFACFLTALSIGPISLVDPLWICLYSLTSLFIGIRLINERPSLIAVCGIALYVFGAAFMGLTEYEGGDTGNLWALYVVMGGIANGFFNYGLKTYAAKIDMFILVGAIYLVASLGLAIFGAVQNPQGWTGLLTPDVFPVILAMGIFQSVWVILMITALLKGPLSLVDPLWACIYALGSVCIGMAAIGEAPAPLALAGVGLYLIGAYLMSRQKPPYLPERNR